MPDASPWWTPDVHADRRPRLIMRNAIAAETRAWFGARDFVEVTTGALQVSPGNEAHLSAFSTTLVGEDGARSTLYLHTSPEFACKKLLAAGETRLFSLGPVYRNGERSRLHHPEFTMLEWYRVGETYEALMDDAADLIALAAERAGSKRFRFRGREADPFATPERLTVAEAFERHAGIDLLATVEASGATDRDSLARAMAASGMRVAEGDSWGDLVSRALVERVEPQLGNGCPTILMEYPIPEAALARPSPGNPKVAERFEIYCCGVELANAFGELTDAAVQRRRFEAEMDERERIYGERYPLDEDFLAALAVMPESSGIALGFDRMVMLAVGAERIDDVIWAPMPWPEPAVAPAPPMERPKP